MMNPRELPRNLQVINWILRTAYSAADERLEKFKNDLLYMNGMKPLHYMYIDIRDEVKTLLEPPEPTEVVKAAIREQAHVYEPVILEKSKVTAFLLGIFTYYGESAYMLLPHTIPESVANSIGYDRLELNSNLEESLALIKLKPEFTLLHERLFLEGLLA